MASSSFYEIDNADEDISRVAEAAEESSDCWRARASEERPHSSRKRWRRPALGLENFS